jgi:hypothetical protein
MRFGYIHSQKAAPNKRFLQYDDNFCYSSYKRTPLPIAIEIRGPAYKEKKEYILILTGTEF